jgi:hypothetical protein
MEEFAKRVVAGNATYTTADVIGFCMEKTSDEHQDGDNATTMCSMVAAQVLATDPVTDQPLLSAENVQQHGGAWVCNATAMAETLCDGGDKRPAGAVGYSSFSNDGAMVARRDCTTCGQYMEEFAKRAAAGDATYSKADVIGFCMEKTSNELQGGGGSSQLDSLNDPDSSRCNTIGPGRACRTEVSGECAATLMPWQKPLSALCRHAVTLNTSGSLHVL